MLKLFKGKNMEPTFTSNSEKIDWPGLDVMKFLCILFMIITHAYWSLFTFEDKIMITNPNVFEFFKNMRFIGIFPLMIPFTAGCIFRLTVPLNSANRLPLSQFITISISAVVIGLVGFCMNVLSAGPGSFFEWNVLQFIGVSFIVIGVLVRYFPMYSVLIAGAVVLMGSVPLRTYLGTLPHHYWIMILTGDTTGFHAWPFFPWFSTVALGFMGAHYYLKYHNYGAKLTRVGIGCGLLFLVLPILKNQLTVPFDPEGITGSAVFQPPIVFVLYIMGLACLLTIGVTMYFRNRRLPRYGIINCFSKGILWIYLIHMVVGAKLYQLFNMDIYSKSYMINNPFVSCNGIILIIFPSFLILLSWLIGFLSIRYLHDKQLKISIKKMA